MTLFNAYESARNALDLRIEEREELDARRAAEQRKLCLECHMLKPAAWPQGLHADDEIEIHIIEPRTWRCIAVRRSWARIRRLVEDMKPLARRRFNEQTTGCALHPLPIAQDNDEGPA